MAAKSRDRWRHQFFSVDNFIPRWPSKYSYWSDVAFYVCNYVIMKAPMMSLKKSHSFPELNHSEPGVGFAVRVVAWDPRVLSSSPLFRWINTRRLTQPVIVPRSAKMSTSVSQKAAHEEKGLLTDLLNLVLVWCKHDGPNGLLLHIISL